MGILTLFLTPLRVVHHSFSYDIVLLCTYILYTYAIVEFTMVPSSLVVNVGEEAVFQCRYPGATINWRINGAAVVLSPFITVTSSGQQSSDTLTITALPEYNETVIECVALLQDLSTQRAPLVQLIINCKLSYYHSFSQ